jgi:hypothetical protein
MAEYKARMIAAQIEAASFRLRARQEEVATAHKFDSSESTQGR